MFNVTEAEQNAFDDIQAQKDAIQEKIRDLSREFHQLSTSGYAEDREVREERLARRTAINTEVENLKKAVENLEALPASLVVMLKKDLNAQFSKSFPGGVDMYLTLAEQMVATLAEEDSPSQRAMGLIKTVLLKVFSTGLDPDIARVRAESVAVRYKALIEAGIPLSVAQNIIVAEASRPYPMINLNRK